MNMKKLSIKGRVTLWYTSLLIMLLCVVVVYLFAFSGQVFTRQIKYKLLDIVSDTVQEVRFHNGEMDTEDMDFYKDGVSIFVYDTNGRLIAPRINRGMQVDSILEDQSVKRVVMEKEVWMVHDLYAEKDDTGFWVRGIISTSEVTSTLQNMIILALCAVPVFIGVAWIGGWLITKRAFAVIGEMTKTAESIISGEDLTLRLPNDSSGDEISNLSATINKMLARLQKVFERERQFTSDASHELRTPVSIILSQCEYGLETVEEKEKQYCFEAILRQGKRMSTLLSQLLLLARADSGRFQPDWERVDFSELCEMTVEEWEEKAQEEDIKLQCNIESGISLWADETLCIRLLTNLIGNAVKYNKKGGNVIVSLKKENESCILSVKDTGKGISKEEQEKIWHRFYRGDSARSSEGTGLGLSMVKWICTVHRGEIFVESEPDIGSIFTIKFPLEKKD